MLAPLKWLKDYVDIDVSPKEFGERMTMSGTKVEKVEEIGKEINNVVVGKILEIKQHPDADRLVVTKVDVGNEIIQIVTGANNISEGDYIPVATMGATLPGGVKIKKSKLRGIESQGMMCSAQELNLDTESLPQEQIVGIYILEKAYPLGMDIKEIFGLNEVLVEFELTYNRPDCLSIIGLSREAAATLNKPLILPSIKIINEEDDIKDYATIEVQDAKLCPRYAAKIIKDIKVEPSPQWIQDRLAKGGVRSINNIVDVTNYVMMEMGQPLHAFDYDKLAENKIVVRRANEGEKIVTLDEVERNLDPSMLVIADANEPLAIAGVMGGGNSEVDENTKTILLEAANFDKTNIRLTAKKVGLRTEASSRYEKGIDPNLIELAMNRAAQLLEEIQAGIVVKGHIDHYASPVQPHHILLDPKWVNKFIGIDISPEQMADYLERLDMEVTINESLEVTIPTFRQDLQIPEDLAEEIARLYGYDKIPSTIMSGVTVQGIKTYTQKIEDKIKDLIVGEGGHEIYTYSFSTPQSLELLNISQDDKNRKALMLLNPLGEENSMMRTTLMGNMMQVISRNINYHGEEAFFFELGSTYHPKQLPIKEMPIETKTLCIAMYGGVDFFHIKGIVENLLETCGISKYEFQAHESSSFHPGRTAQVVFQDEVLGIVGEIHPDVAENYNISQPIYIGEFDIDLLSEKSNVIKKYKELPKYPAVTRDIALLMKEEIPARAVEKIIENQGTEIIESYSLFDVYQGKQIPDGYKSMAYSIVYRKSDGTLTDKEVNKVHEVIVRNLENKLDAQLRE